MTRDEVLAALAPERGFQVRAIGERPVVLVEQDDDGKISGVSLRPDKGARSVDMTKEGIEGMMKRIGLGPELTKKLSPRTVASVAGEALGRSRLAVMVKDQEIIDVVPNKSMRLVQPERVLRTLEKAVPGCNFHRVLTLPNHVVHLETIGVEEKAVSRGDMIRAGVLTKFSVLGQSMPEVQTFVNRLACTNGATTNDVLASFDFNEEGGDFEHWLRLKARQAYRSLDKVVTRWQELVNQTIPAEERAEYLAHWIRESKMPPEAVEAIHAQALRQPPQNQYDLLNLMTWATSHVDMQPQLVARTMGATAEMQNHEQHGKRCPICHRSR